MKDFYHLCLTAHDEVLLRNEEDARQFINLIALSAFRSGAELLTDSELSTHFHMNAMCEKPVEFLHRLIDSGTKYFNNRYSRRGRLFDADPFYINLKGPHRIQMSLCYGLRQGMHHGITQTPFEYPWSTCNSLFCAERGIPEETACFRGPSDMQYVLPKNAKYPEEWTADKNGILLRSGFENIKLVETWFGTARGYLTSMNRKTSEDWLREQDEDKVDRPRVTLQMIESGYTEEEIQAMLTNEGNAKFVQRQKTDMEICELIDRHLLNQFHVVSVYELDIAQKLKLMDELRFEYKLNNPKQLARCVALKY